MKHKKGIQVEKYPSFITEKDKNHLQIIRNFIGIVNQYFGLKFPYEVPEKPKQTLTVSTRHINNPERFFLLRHNCDGANELGSKSLIYQVLMANVF